MSLLKNGVLNGYLELFVLKAWGTLYFCNRFRFNIRSLGIVLCILLSYVLCIMYETETLRLHWIVRGRRKVQDVFLP